MAYEKDESHQHRLLNTAFELNLSMPTNDLIANAIFYDKDCNEIQSKNNLSFLSLIESYIDRLVRQSELDYKKDNYFNGSPDCSCDYDCECNLNIFVMSAFKNIARQFNLDVDTNETLVNTALASYTTEEQQRLLSCNIPEVLRIIMYKSLSCLSYELGFYYVSCKHHEVAILIYGGAISDVSFDEVSYVEAVASNIGRKAAGVRWSKHNQTRPEKKKQYLQIMDEQNFTTFAETATYIKQHIETGKKPSYRTIELWLSQASKDDFS